VRFYRIGDKVISREKLLDAVDAILEDRQSGATQEEAARHANVQRSFISFLEALGEVRRGPRIALVAFPVENREEVVALAESHGVDFTLVISQAERESIELGDASDVFNKLLDTLAVLRDFDIVVLLASDSRIDTIGRILGAEIVGVPLGRSPLREDVHVDVDELQEVLSAVMDARRDSASSSDRVGDAVRLARDIAGRWTRSNRS
jgi:hypothetical protein